MADTKISALPASTTPLAGTEVLPIVQSGATVKVSVANLTAGRAIAATGVTSTGKITAVYAAGGDFVAEFQNTSSGTPYGVFIKDAATPAAGYPVLAVSDSTGATTHFRVDSSTGNTGVGGVPSNSASVRLKVTGSAEVASGNLIIGTSGNGIDFSATPGTGTSELLADYEEGDWTPSDGSGAGLAFTGVVGRYTKIGQVVTYFGDVTYPVTVDGSGMTIAGLPFTSNSALNRTGSVISTTVNAVGAVVPPSTSVVLVFPAGSLTPPTNATLSTARLIFAGSYQV